MIIQPMLNEISKYWLMYGKILNDHSFEEDGNHYRKLEVQLDDQKCVIVKRNSETITISKPY